MTLGDQFLKILEPRLKFADIEMSVAKLIEKQMHDNVDIGQGFQGHRATDRFNRVYQKKYAKSREKAGFQVAHTDLQREKKRIKNTFIQAQDGAVISFKEDGHIFELHQTGKARGGKIRSIFPQSGDASIPADILTETKKLLTAKLRG